jgi:cephalosporin-C deacetylase
MKATVSLLSMLLPVCAMAQSIVITSDHTNAMYKCGETAVFTVQVLDAKKAPVKTGKAVIQLDNFGPKKVAAINADLSKGNPVTIKGSLAEPGFLKCTATAAVGTNRLRAVWGTAYDPLKLRQGGPCPKDFDEFWGKAVTDLDKTVPLDAKQTRIVARSDDKHDSYRVSFATYGGGRVYGFLCVPKGKGPFPVQVNVPGAGLGSYTPDTRVADQGFITLIMCVHSFAPGKDTAEQTKLYNAQDEALKKKWNVPRYCFAGATSRETYFYYPVILGINRAVNWLWSQENVDKTRFIYTGTSQGGGFGFYLCGLNRHFTKGVSHVPALTDLLGFKEDRMSGWPRLIEALPEKDRAIAEKDVAPYFDAANFAARITCPYRVSVGFSDETCPPCAVYSGYNAIKVKDKAIVHGLGMPHHVYGWIYNQLDSNWVRK